MSKIDVFEIETPPVANGGSDAARDLFERDLVWLHACGIEIARHAFEHNAAAFHANEAVYAALETDGIAALPLVLVDGTIVSAGAYPSRLELARALGLAQIADEDRMVRLVAAGAALGHALARHDAPAIETAHARVLQLGLDRATFTQATSALVSSTAASDPQAVEALDRLAAYGTLKPPRRRCCGG